MAEYVSGPSSSSSAAAAWHSGTQSPVSGIHHRDPTDIGVTGQQSPVPPEVPPVDSVGSQTDLDVPYPDLAPVVFFCLKQTTTPRNWCIKLVWHPHLETLELIHSPSSTIICLYNEDIRKM
ncbi:voltage-dependent T-type calcium channel subunit alpha-1I [Microcaecilia unicolor]|uniref:Voltage-dependent T-type calcium channel subunit alpha-1I-like n=1 Tax=Microcaecilia unicolor TaxID=1415580 RepID=A0A6P7Z0P4_9AMPH|nr:voltage-dependent T-type calcium channel subunit alpha-1I-like [Microcaecilia unicolor]